MSASARRAAALALGGAALAIPLLTWLVLPHLPCLGTLGEPFSGGSTFPASTLRFQRSRVGPAPDPQAPPRITNVQAVDFDGDGLCDVVACDANAGAVIVYRQAPRDTWTERVLARELPVPAHAAFADLDGDGTRDVIVAVLGDLFPNDERVGSVVVLDGAGDAFTPRVLLAGVRRVADVQPGDLDGDGDVDLAVAVFGYSHGEVLWLENRGPDGFLPHALLAAAGTIHVPIADLDGDGDLDVATVASQDDETVWAFENLGGGRFRTHRVWSTLNFDLGSAGLVHADLDRDGDVDLVLPVGDNFENDHTYPQPYHGCLWLENRGGFAFELHRIASFGGTYAAGIGDFDGDGDPDVALVSMFNEWRRPGGASAIWLENDGKAGFRAMQIDTDPTHLVTVACGDLDGDGRSDIVAGGLHVIAPWSRLGRITAWRAR